jgi:hypothetical protein
MIIMIIMRQITVADLIWVSTAMLTRETPERKDFAPEEIRRRAYELHPDHGFTDSTIRTHITSHCVANKKADPGKHRKLFMTPSGRYRLYLPGDNYHPDRKTGKELPKAADLPEQHRGLLDWYHSEYDRSEPTTFENDPILGLQGLGQEVWESLGGGEKFIRELRANWYGDEDNAARTPGETPDYKRAV